MVFDIELEISKVLNKAFYSGRIPFGGVMAILPNGDEFQVNENGFLLEGELSSDSGFWIASLSKAIASVGAMILVERGLVGLDEPLGKYVDFLKNPYVLDGFDLEENPVTREAGSEITLRQLLSHTSGLAYPFTDERISQYAKTRELPPTISGQRSAYTLPLVSNPGFDWFYGVSTDWVGQVIETISGSSLEDFYYSNIFEPLGMRNTFFKSSDEFEKRRMPIYRRVSENSFKPIDFSVPQNPEMPAAGAGLYSTPADYFTFIKMLLGKGAYKGVSILSQGSVQLFSDSQVIGLNVGCIESSNTELTLDYDPQPGVVKGWSLGFSVTLESLQEGRKIGSFGWAGLSNIYYWIDPKSNLAAIFYTQVLPFGDKGALETSKEVESVLYRFSS